MKLQALQIGGLAEKALDAAGRGKVMGVTSKGVFLNLNNRILFLTEADYRSPYNIQVAGLHNLNGILEPGMEWEAAEEELRFPSGCISLQGAPVWKPAVLPAVDTTPSEQLQRMEILLHAMREFETDKGWLFLADETVDSAEKQEIRAWTDHFCRGFRENDLAACLENGRRILGRGGGLTPSGDDWLTGFLLFYCRKGDGTSSIKTLSGALIEQAFLRTTTISANRIEAAAQGWAEEIFLDVLDTLFLRDHEVEDLNVEQLSNFGHSSGVDTCMGIYAACKTSLLQ